MSSLPKQSVPQNRDSLAFAGTALFALLIFLRPQELFPEIFGTFPLVKIVAISTLALYGLTRLANGQGLTVWPTEVKLLGVLLILAFGLTPIAYSPQASLDLITDTWLKSISLFLLIINLANSHTRLKIILNLFVVCGMVTALSVIHNYWTGSQIYKGRVYGSTNLFGDPNDLAMLLDLVIAISLSLGLRVSGLKRACYFICAALCSVAVVLTQSRGGFLGLAVVAGIFLWKFNRHNLKKAILAVVLGLAVLTIAMPGYLGNRIATIIYPDEDTTGSAQQRINILMQGLSLALRHSIVGLGAGNYTNYSIRSKPAHNSYVEIAAELGILGLVAYVSSLILPLHALRRTEKELATEPLAHGPLQATSESYSLNIGLQAALAAFMICSFFLSVQYLYNVYFLVACAIAFRHIGSITSASCDIKELPLTKGPLANSLQTGVLWGAGTSGNLNQKPLCLPESRRRTTAFLFLLRRFDEKSDAECHYSLHK